MVNKNLEDILQMHKLWLNSGGIKGKRANLYGVNLTDADLYGADLRNANLYGVNLTDADLYGANLSGANLYGVNLYDADLRYANLYEADLRYADLRYANLSGANLSGTNLSGANLRYANLYEADLRYADLRYANLSGANLSGANLSQTNTERIKGIIVHSIDNVGTYNGKITYMPSLNMVYAGCWTGTTEEFFVKCKEVMEENDRDLHLDIALSMVKQLHDKYKKMNRGQSK